MSEILSQAEIEALLNSLAETQANEAQIDTPARGGGSAAPAKSGSGGASFSSPSAHSRGAIAYEVYDFRRPDKFSKEQLRTLQMIHDTFARHAATGLSAYLRSPVSIELISLEQIPYEEYLKGIGSSIFTVMSVPPLTGQAVLELEFPVTFSMVDRLLGGPGRPVERHVLTDIERPLVKQMIERIFAALKTAWEGVVIINPNIEQLETTSQFVQIAPPNDIVVTILFEVKIGNLRGAMSVCIPYLVLKPITQKLSAQKWFVSNARKNSQSNRRLLSWQVSQSTVDCSVLLGKTRLNVRDFLTLQPGDVVPLDQDTRDDLTFLVSKTPKFYGKPATSGRRLLFSISHAITQDQP